MKMFKFSTFKLDKAPIHLEQRIVKIATIKARRRFGLKIRLR